MKKKLFYGMGLLVASVPSLCFAASALPYGSGWYNEAQIFIAYQDNVNRGEGSAYSLSDNTASLTIGRGYLKKTGSSSQITVSGYLTYTRHEDYDSLSNLASAIEFRFIHQPAPGFYRLWYESALNVTRLDYKDSDVREGYLLELDLSLNQRLSTQLTGRVGYHYANFGFPGKSQEARKKSQAFDTLTNKLYVGVEYQLHGGAFVYAEYGYLTGNFTSSVPRLYDSNDQYGAISVDWAFESCAWGICKPYWAYLTDGDIQRGDVGLSFPLFGMNFDLSAQYANAEADSGVSYQDWSVQLGAILNF